MPRTERRLRAAAAALVVFVAPHARADEAALLRKVDQLESRVREIESARDQERAELEGRVRELETSRTQGGAGAADWTRRVRLSGSANAGYFDGEPNSGFDQGSFEIWDARLFIDAELGRDVRLGGTKLVRDVGLSFEWNAVRLGQLQHGFDQTIGELYLDFQGLGDQDWLSVQVGRFQVPVGENYLRFSKGYSTNPFISNTVGGAWWWDEGIRVYGRFLDGRLGYVASVSNGETGFNADGDAAKQLTLKLWTEPAPWLHLSASALRSGTLGSPAAPGMGALWLGETWAMPVGSISPIPTFVDGAPIGPAPNQLRDTFYFGGDAIVHVEDAFRLWLSYGRYDMGADRSRLHDRVLHSWIAELVLEGALASEPLRPFYLAARANGIGTYDANRGYLLDVRDAWTIGYNARSLDVYSLGLGWRISEWATLRAEYQLRDVELVRGVGDAVRRAARANDAFAVELGAHF